MMEIYLTNIIRDSSETDLQHKAHLEETYTMVNEVSFLSTAV